MATAYQIERRRLSAAIALARDFAKRGQAMLDANIDPLDRSTLRASMRRASLELSASLVAVRKSAFEGE